MTESVIVHAAEGTRELTLDLLQISLAENDQDHRRYGDERALQFDDRQLAKVGRAIT